MTRGVGATFAVVVGLVGCALTAWPTTGARAANEVPFDVTLNGLVCSGVNDAFLQGSSDETFVVVIGKRKSDGKEYRYRLPGETTYWNLKGSQNSPQGVPIPENRPLSLLHDTLGEGDEVDVIVQVWEEDNGSLRSRFNEYAGKLMSAAASSGDPLAMGAAVVGNVLNSVFGSNLDDDHLGTVAVRVKNAGGSITFDSRGIKAAQQYEKQPNVHKFRMTDGGSLYTVGVGAAKR